MPAADLVAHIIACADACQAPDVSFHAPCSRSIVKSIRSRGACRMRNTAT